MKRQHCISVPVSGLPRNIAIRTIPIADTAKPYPIDMNHTYFLKPIELTSIAAISMTAITLILNLQNIHTADVDELRTVRVMCNTFKIAVFHMNVSV